MTGAERTGAERTTTARTGPGDRGRAAATIPVECERLARTLRELRAATGLSLAALAAKTPYSKSSWERYLNGKALPPRAAVEQLCTLAGERRDRPVALWELAESTWSGRAGAAREPTAAPPGPPDPPGPSGPAAPVAGEGAAAYEGGAPPRRRRSTGVIAGVLGGLAAVAAGVLLAVWGVGGDSGEARGTESPGAAAPGPSCVGDACTGKDAEATRCSDAAHPPSTLAEHRFGGGTVIKVRRSARCGTVWARVDRGRAGDRVEINAPGIGAQQAEVRDRFDAEGSMSTPMAAAGRGDLPEVAGCLVRDGERRCFKVGGDGVKK